MHAACVHERGALAYEAVPDPEPSTSASSSWRSAESTDGVSPSRFRDPEVRGPVRSTALHELGGALAEQP